MALGAAISPTITAIAFALLGSGSRGRMRVCAFGIGAALSMLFWVLIVSSFMWGLVVSVVKDVDRYSRFIDLVVGCLLVVYGILRFLNRKRESARRKRFDFSPLTDGPYKRQAAFGAIMQGRNVTSVLLFCAAQQRIDLAPIPLWQTALLTLFVIGVVTLSIWVVLIVPPSVITHFSRWLEPTHGWLSRNASRIEVVAAVGFGAYLIILALTG